MAGPYRGSNPAPAQPRQQYGVVKQPARQEQGAPQARKGSSADTRQGAIGTPRACLTGMEIARLLRGDIISAQGTDFVYDGSYDFEVQAAVGDLLKAGQPAQQPLTSHQPQGRFNRR